MAETTTRLYRPSNSSEGDRFMEAWCRNCARNDPDDTGEDTCPINLDAFVYEVGDIDYPREWCYRDGKPTCTAFLAAGSEPALKPLPGQLGLPFEEGGRDGR